MKNQLWHNLLFSFCQMPTLFTFVIQIFAYFEFKLDVVAPLGADPPYATRALCTVDWFAQKKNYVMTETAYLLNLAKPP